MDNIIWHKYNKDDSSTYPETEHKRYLITYTNPFRKEERDIALLYWNILDKWSMWEADGSKILFWAEFDTEPCMK